MRLAVICSRTFKDYNLLKSKLDYINNLKQITCIVSGGSNGADKLAEKWADDNNIPKKIYLAEWNNLDVEHCQIKYNKYGNAYNCLAGYNRNEDIIKNSDRVLAFWDNSSKGTLHSINLAKKYNKPIKVIKYIDEIET